METVLVTGGAGYIGSHTAVELLHAGYRVIVVDNLSNSYRLAVARVEEISGKKVEFYENDLRDTAALQRIFAAHQIDSVIHFAGLKAVGESVEKPLEYYQNNVAGTLSLSQVMLESGVSTIVFSSSCTVYGDPQEIPVKETTPVGAATNPYGWSKIMVEQILQDLHLAHPYFDVTLLRYFNPAGAHSSGLLGEDPRGIPNNLFPYIAQVIAGKLEKLSVFGGDYPTTDGTGVRDYIHVVDLALGHLHALKQGDRSPEVRVFNLGTGRGYSVLEIIDAFERACGVKIPYQITDRRPGDIAETYADVSRSAVELNWRAERDIDQICRDAWNWQVKNPNGLET